MADWETRELAMLAADLDDESPQVVADAQAKALSLGALDCVVVPTHMKKGRAGLRVEILCEPADAPRFVEFLLTHTATLGVRESRVRRHALRREERTLPLRGGEVRVKVALLDGRPLRAAPEFEDCRALAERLGVPVREIVEEARAGALRIARP
ncbi:MAG: nickel insertion protein [Candidatus Sumerlaeia bacterium]|nr:nickel insertion protein [Candidatus Sumerlaeia bacterium]